MSKQGRLIGLALALAALAGCASDGYVYHEDGYWTGPTPARAVVVYDASSACAPWYDPFGYGGVHAWYPCSGFGPGPYLGYGYYGYYDPYWAYRAPRPSLGERRDAREQGRWMMQRERPDLAQFPRYEELAPQRRRDIGGGDRAWPSAGFGSFPDSRASRAGIGSGSRGSSGLSAASGGRLSGGASAPAPRVREARNEE
ncbi:MAG: hypothetical protein U1F26_17140 [Lysobacterales bacterium]